MSDTVQRLLRACVEADAPGLKFEEFLAAQPDLATKAWPRFVRISEHLPSTATNKVLKRELVRQGLDFEGILWTRAERGTSYSAAERRETI